MLKYLFIRHALADTDVLLRNFLEYDKNGVIVLYNYAGDITVAHAPESLPLKKNYRFYRAGTWTANRWLKWSMFVIQMTRIMFSVLRRTRVCYFVVGGGDVLAWIAQLFKNLGRIEHTINLLEDWSLPSPQESRANRIKTYINDFLLLRMDTHVIQTGKIAFDNRNRHFHNRTLKNTVLHDHFWAWFLEREVALPVKSERRSICFLGNVRYFFGMESVFDLLPELNREFGFRLKVICPETELFVKFKAIAESKGASPYIDWLGFVPNERLRAGLEDCFCGINLHELTDNNNQFAVAGRVVVYIQHLVVPIMTRISGPTVGVLQEHKMGVICEPDRASIRAAIVEGHRANAKYVANLDRFLTYNPYRQSIGVLFADPPQPDSKLRRSGA